MTATTGRTAGETSTHLLGENEVRSRHLASNRYSELLHGVCSNTKLRGPHGPTSLSWPDRSKLGTRRIQVLVPAIMRPWFGLDLCKYDLPTRGFLVELTDRNNTIDFR